MGLMMYWYVVHIKLEQGPKLVSFFNQQNNIKAFIPKMERLLDNKNIIRHSVGNIVNSKLIVEEGPLVNLENKVIKIDRHKRLAILKSDFFNKITVPLEVVSKS